MQEGLRKSLRQVTKCGHQGRPAKQGERPSHVRRRTPPHPARRRGQGGGPRRSGTVWREAW